MRYGMLLTALVLCTTLAAGDGKRMDRMMERQNEFSFIEQHEKELGLSDAQKKELKTLAEKTKESREKLMKSPEARAAMESMRQAKKNGDDEEVREMRQKLMASMIEKDGEYSPAMNMRAIAGILTPDQRAKLQDLRQKEGKPSMAEMREKRKDAKGDKNTVANKPDPARGVPSLYENEK